MVIDNWLGNEWTVSNGESGYRVEKEETLTEEPLFPDLDGNGTASETGVSITVTKLYESQINPDGTGEATIMYKDENGQDLGGYQVRGGYKVVIDGNWAPTGEMVSAFGEALNIYTDLFALDTWSVDPSVISTWATDNSQTGTEEEIADAWYTAFIAEMTSDFEESQTEFLMDYAGELSGIKVTGSVYSFEITGNLTVDGDLMSGEGDVSGTLNGGMIYKNGAVLADGSGLFELDADTFGIIMDAFGFFDDGPSDDDDYDDDDDDGLGPIGGDGTTTGPASVDVRLDKIVILDNVDISENDMAQVSLNGTPVDLTDSNITFTASYMDGAEKFAETDYTHPEPPYDGPAITGAVYDGGNDVLTITLGDPGADAVDVGNIFVGGTALDINDSAVTFTEDVPTDPNSPVPATVTVTGLGLTGDTDIIHDADGDANLATDTDPTSQQTVTVTVGSEPPYDGDAITGAVYDVSGDVLTITLGDPGASEADVAKIFIGAVALDITSVM